MRPCHIAILTTLVVLQPSVSRAQVSARQGTPEDIQRVAEPTEFKSPMILEAPFPVQGVAAAPNGLPMFFREFTRFTCEGVAVPIIEFRVLRKKGQADRLEARFHIQNRTDDDKWVDLVAELLVPGAEPRRIALRKIDAESNKRVIRKLELSYAGIAELPEPPMLRISVSTIRN